MLRKRRASEADRVSPVADDVMAGGSGPEARRINRVFQFMFPIPARGQRSSASHTNAALHNAIAYPVYAESRSTGQLQARGVSSAINLHLNNTVY